MRGARTLKLTGSLAALALVSSCSARTDEPVASSSEAITSICGQAPGATTPDGYPAFKWCGDFDVYSNDGKNTSSSAQSGWVKTEGGYGYQCVEFAKRYFYFRWGTGQGWFIPGAKDMCTTYPSGVSKTSSGTVGDLMVMGAGSCGADGTFGHVGVISADHGTKWQLTQENPAGQYDWPKSCALCYLHAANNNGGGTVDPCSTVQYGGLYCGESPQWSGGTPGTLYDCENGATASKTVCPYGCNVAPAGTNDSCKPAPPSDGGSSGTGGADSGSAGSGASGGSSAGSGGLGGWSSTDSGIGAKSGGDAGVAASSSGAKSGVDDMTASSGCSTSGASGPRGMALALAFSLALLGLTRRRSV